MQPLGAIRVVRIEGGGLVMLEPAFLETRPNEYDPAGSTKAVEPEVRLEETLISVWRQAFVDKADSINVSGRLFPVRSTPKRHLLQVDFNWNGKVLRGLEQNPETSSRWAQLARQGHRIMQFLCRGRYIGNVVDGKVTFYGRRVGETGLNRESGVKLLLHSSADRQN